MASRARQRGRKSLAMTDFHDIRSLLGLQLPPPYAQFCIFSFLLFWNSCSSQAFSRRLDAPSTAIIADGLAGATRYQGPPHQGHLQTQPESLAMEDSQNSMQHVPQQHQHQHLHMQTLYSSLAMEEAVAMKGSSPKVKDTHIDSQRQHLDPETFFEVSTPLDPPPRSPCASLPILKHSFANTYTAPPAMANYNPPSPDTCKDPSHWSLIVLKWSGSSIGRQFDRIAGVWFGGVELLRTCTAEPTKRGIFWEVKKDVTKYASLLATPQPVVVELGNLVNGTLTGIFHINLTLDFFLASHVTTHRPLRDRHAQLIIPVSSPSPLPSGHWFQIPNGSYVPQKIFWVPRNVYKAVLEVYVSFHGDDEFWYTNPPNEYITSNNLTGVPGNGPFREVQAYLDDRLVAAIWPFPVVYTGGIINLYWRPAAAIGAFDLPTYEFDLSPFVGALTDGKKHTLGIRVENALGNWLIDGCLQLWLDETLDQTSGKLVSYMVPAYTTALRSEFKGLDGTFRRTASRTLSYSGYVVSSMGNLSVSSSYALEYNNVLAYSNHSALQTASQAIHSKGEIRTEAPSSMLLFQESSYSFPLDLSCLSYEGANSSLVLNCSFSHAYDKKISTVSGSGSSLSLLNNRQHCQGEMVVVNSMVVSGLAALQQQYRSEGTDGCYARVLSTKNSTILYDFTNSSCSAIKSD